MKPYIYITGALALIASVSSCNKVELPDYSGMDAIFFDQQFIGDLQEGWNDTTTLAHKLYTPVSFNSISKTDTILAIKIETTGYVRDYLRPFGVHVVADSTTATLGEDFELLDDSYAILPGNNSTYVHVKLNLTDRMYLERLQIQLGLDAGEHFELPFGKYAFGDMPHRYNKPVNDPVPESRNYDCSVHNIFVDCMLSRPATWPLLSGHQYYLGEYSNAKFALILSLVEYRGWTASTFNSAATMPMDRIGIVNDIIAKYLRQKFDEKDYVLEDDGTLMWVKNATYVSWAAGVTPEELNKQ